MTTPVTVIVPWEPGCPHRETAWAWVRSQWETEHPDWPIIEQRGNFPPWCKATAVLPAVEAAPDGIVIVADADVWSDGITAAVAAITDGSWNWAIPHRLVYRLNQPATAHLLEASPGPDATRDADLLDRSNLTQPPYRGVAGGGIVILTRTLALDIPLDPRFTGWGGEDHAWGYALRSLAGQPHRTPDPLVHLWHPPAPRIRRRVGSDTNERLRDHYWRARKNPARMRRLITEGKNTWHSQR